MVSTQFAAVEAALFAREERWHMNMRFGYDNHCLLRDGTAWFPVMGEIHYSRYKESLWEESLRKIKAGGVEIVSSYVIWIHHE